MSDRDRLFLVTAAAEIGATINGRYESFFDVVRLAAREQMKDAGEPIIAIVTCTVTQP